MAGEGTGRQGNGVKGPQCVSLNYPYNSLCPTAWNSLPDHLRDLSLSENTFRRSLNTTLVCVNLGLLVVVIVVVVVLVLM